MKKGMQARTLDPSATLRVKMKRPWGQPPLSGAAAKMGGRTNIRVAQQVPSAEQEPAPYSIRGLRSYRKPETTSKRLIHFNMPLPYINIFRSNIHWVRLVLLHAQGSDLMVWSKMNLANYAMKADNY